MRNRPLFWILALGISVAANAQTKFNFQTIDVLQDARVVAVNNNGAILCHFVDPRYQIWTPQGGLSHVTYKPFDNYRPAISDSGKLYGESRGSVIQFDMARGQSVLFSRSAYTYAIVDASDDNLLISAKRGSQTRYYTVKSGVKAGPLSMPSGFVPVSIGGDGVIRGTETADGGTFASQVRRIVRLNSNGTTSQDPLAVDQVSSYDGYNSSWNTQTIQSMSDGTVVVRQSSNTSGYHSSGGTVWVDTYFPSGKHLQTIAGYSQSFEGSGYYGSLFGLALSDERILIRPMTSPFDFVLTDWVLPNYVADSQSSLPISDPSILESGSVIPDRLAAGSHGGVLVGVNYGSHWTISVSIPPSTPASRLLKILP
ncbi:MAG: hypothetical protein JST51_15780 [Armatimonadetes bacterium]|nr:hypothetical protein [Armatimonadota bacterium]